MAAEAEEGMLGSIFSIFIAAWLFAVTVCFLVLCTLCQRKNRSPAPDGELLAEATELSSLRGSVTNVQKLGRTNSRAKNLSPATITIPCDDDGTVSSCSFIILPQRELPRPPSADPLSPEQTYSNLTFLKQSQEVLYETVAVKGDKEEEPKQVAEEAVAGKSPVDHETADGYAKVRKGKKKKTVAELETRTKPTIQESGPTATASTPTTLKLEEMYAVVCKDKKKKKTKNGVVVGKNGGPQLERSRGRCHVESVPQASEGMEGHQSSLFQPHLIEPCYASIRCESRADVGEKESEEPAYETVETHWKRPRKKGKPKSKAAAAATENLYESIENLAFQF